jgi:hypothetical protein
MTLLYGATFTRQYGDEPIPLWIDALATVTDGECAIAFAKLRDTPREWPPNLTEFLGVCRNKSPGVRHLGVPLSDEQRANLLPAPGQIATPDTRDRYLASMRARLGVRKPTTFEREPGCDDEGRP